MILHISKSNIHKKRKHKQNMHKVFNSVTV